MILQVFIIYVLLVNLIAFVLFGADKIKAVKGKWRVSEAVLFLSALLGGSVGALLGMKIFHNKTRHKKFTTGVPLLLIIQIVFVVLYYSYNYTTLNLIFIVLKQ